MIKGNSHRVHDAKKTDELASKSKIVNECGSVSAKALQDKLNGDAFAKNDKDSDKSRKAKDTKSHHHKLNLKDPFVESEQRDIDQIEGRLDGNLVHYLSNGEYVISYAGIMKLAEKHSISFSVSINDETKTVIAYAKRNGSSRVSGKPVKVCGSYLTATELAKRNAARQLLPYAEIKAMEHKAKLSATFNWQKAKAKCLELVNDANLSIIIHDLVQAGKLRQDNPSHYDRTEWLVIFNACKKDAQVERDPKSLNRWSYNSTVFLEQCREAIAKVREKKKSLKAKEQYRREYKRDEHSVEQKD